MKKVLVLMLFILGLAACNSSQDLIAAKTNIAELEQSIQAVEQSLKQKIIFPTLIAPQLTTPLYAFANLSQAKQGMYLIEVDATPDCQGVHACNVGAEIISTQKLKWGYQDMQGKDISQHVTLKNGEVATFIPGHAMADYWQPTLIWQHNKLWYVLMWKLPAHAEKSLIINMANSANSV